MGWYFRKSLRLLPGIRVNLSRTGPRLSVGIPGARASINPRGNLRLYGGAGPVRYEKAIKIRSSAPRINGRDTVFGLIRRMLGKS
jgi:hypothetical protein